MLYWMHHRNLHSAGMLIHCTCVPSSSFAGNDELVAVEDFEDVCNVLLISFCPIEGTSGVPDDVSGPLIVPLNYLVTDSLEKL